jgi:hypothetical protein
LTTCPNPALLSAALAGGGEDLLSLRTKHDHHFPASTVEQYLRKHFHQSAAAEWKQSLRAQAQACPRTGSKQNSRDV